MKKFPAKGCSGGKKAATATAKMGAGEQYRSCPLFDCDLLSDAISFEAAEPAEPHERRIVYEDTEETRTGIGDKLGPRRCWARAAETRRWVSSGGRSIVAESIEDELVFAIYRDRRRRAVEQPEMLPEKFFSKLKVEAGFAGAYVRSRS